MTWNTIPAVFDPHGRFAGLRVTTPLYVAIHASLVDYSEAQRQIGNLQFQIAELNTELHRLRGENGFLLRQVEERDHG